MHIPHEAFELFSVVYQFSWLEIKMLLFGVFFFLLIYFYRIKVFILIVLALNFSSFANLV